MRRASEPDGLTFTRERQERIAQLLEDQGRARVIDLSRRFGVSAVTIRKDLGSLEAQGRLVRAHGGAISPASTRPENSFEIRERTRPAVKDRIGRMAATMVQDGESIALDASTTALAVARHLKRMEPRTQLTVITNGLRIASELAGTPGVTVVMPGGFVRGEALSLVGQLGDPVFEKVNLQKAFLGAAGFTLEAGLSDATEEEAQIKRSMTRSAREVIAIVDSSKWERVALATFCRFEAITQVITDELAPPAMVASLRARGIEVHEVAAGDADGHSGHQQGRLA